MTGKSLHSLPVFVCVATSDRSRSIKYYKHVSVFLP